jgi:hypothetical protein
MIIRMWCFDSWYYSSGMGTNLDMFKQMPGPTKLPVQDPSGLDNLICAAVPETPDGGALGSPFCAHVFLWTHNKCNAWILWPSLTESWHQNMSWIISTHFSMTSKESLLAYVRKPKNPGEFSNRWLVSFKFTYFLVVLEFEIRASHSSYPSCLFFDLNNSVSPPSYILKMIKVENLP